MYLLLNVLDIQRRERGKGHTYLTLWIATSRHPCIFSFRICFYLEILFTSICIPELLVMTAAGDKTISYNSYTDQLFSFSSFMEHLNFTCWQQCPMTTMLPSVSPCITQPSWTVKCASLLLACWVPYHLCTSPPSSKAWPLRFQHCWSLLPWPNSPPADLLLRHTSHWDNGIHLSCGDTCGNVSNGDHVIYLYCINNSKNPLT